MLSSVEQAFVGRDERRALLKNACVGGYVFMNLKNVRNRNSIH